MELRASAILTFSVGCSVVSGCKAGPVWAKDYVSANKQMIVHAKTYDNGGVAAGLNVTEITFEQKEVKGEMPLLIMTGGSTKSLETNVRWLGDHQLLITYSGQHAIQFQALQTDGVQIAVRQAAAEWSR